MIKKLILVLLALIAGALSGVAVLRTTKVTKDRARLTATRNAQTTNL